MKDKVIGETALHTAVEKGDLEVIKSLLEKMTEEEINQVDEYGRTALHLAAEDLNVKNINLLLPKMTKEAMNSVGSSGKTAVMMAADAIFVERLHRGATMSLDNTLKIVDLENIKLLLSNMPENSVSNSYKEKVFKYYLNKGDLETIKFLLPEMSSRIINNINSHGKTALMLAVEQGKLDTAKDLIKSGANVTDNDLSIAILNNNEEMIKYLFSKIPYINRLSDYLKEKIFNYALDRKDLDILKLISPVMPYGSVNSQSFRYGSKTALMRAAESGDVELVKNLIFRGAKVNVGGRSALDNALVRENLDIIKILLSKMTEDEIKGYGGIVLRLAIKKGDLEAVELVKSQISSYLYNIQHYNGETILHLAAKKGNLEMIKFLLPEMSKEAINSVNSSGETALMLAAKHGNLEVVEALMKSGAKGSVGVKSALDYAEKGSSVEKLLKNENSFKMTFQRIYYDVSLFLSQVKSEVKKISYEIFVAFADNNAVAYGYKPYQTNFDYDQDRTEPNLGDTDLQAAIRYNDGRYVDFYLRRNPGLVNDKNFLGDTALHIAIKEKELYCVDLILKYMSSGFNTWNLDGETALNIAVKNRYSLGVQDILNKMPANEVNATDFKGETALHIAVESGHLGIIEMVSKKMTKDDINIVNKSGETALMIAAKHGEIDVVEVLIKNGAKITQLALNIAADNGNSEIVKFLSPKILPKTIVTEKESGKSPLVISAEQGTLDIVEKGSKVETKKETPKQGSFVSLAIGLFTNALTVGGVVSSPSPENSPTKPGKGK
jgi:uncharacterized protein